MKSFTLSSYKIIWWDSAVYIGMGKHIYSFGSSGLWEGSRPLIWPLMLGFLWKTGLNVVLAGRILEILLGASCIFLTYLIGKKLFNEEAALLASAFLALSPTFFFFNGIMLTETVSTFFSLTAVYLFINKKYFLSGIFFGIAFMTRFLQLLMLIAAFLAILAHTDKKSIRNIIKIAAGFILAATPFFIFNQLLYGNAVFPFLHQLYLTINSGWLNYKPLSYYFIALFAENLLYLSFIFGAALVFKGKDADKILIAVAFLLFFLFFMPIKQKEMRFLIVLFPYMYLLASHALTHFLAKIRHGIFKALILAVIFLSFAVSALSISNYYEAESGKQNQYAYFQERIEGSDVTGRIWVSSPIISVFSDKKIERLMYQLIFTDEQKIESEGADFIFVDICDLACKPGSLECEKGKKQLLEHLKQKLDIVYSSKISQCGQYIFKK